MYDELIKGLRVCEEGQHCDLCPKWSDKQSGGINVCQTALLKEAADAIQELSSQLDDFKRLCLPLEENRLYKFADGSFTEVSLMIVPREPTEPPKEES